MKRPLLFLLLSIPFLWSCGETGVETDISKTTTVTFDISKDAVNANPDGSFQLVQLIDFAADDFQQYINDTKSFRIEATI